ncbi:hypothetical protein RRG08_037793 [Elysia crispata]|uniref:Uncharacterized protein n=1 Tax=Elysia crispata TaxID=231223 RepID=A0AAE1BC98_9GAST|nr:hypothetical protein RRG08_037793 [Elysia crispata]
MSVLGYKVTGLWRSPTEDRSVISDYRQVCGDLRLQTGLWRSPTIDRSVISDYRQTGLWRSPTIDRSVEISDNRQVCGDLRLRTGLWRSPTEDRSVEISNFRQVCGDLRLRTGLWRSPTEDRSVEISNFRQVCRDLRLRTGLWRSPKIETYRIARLEPQTPTVGQARGSLELQLRVTLGCPTSSSISTFVGVQALMCLNDPEVVIVENEMSHQCDVAVSRLKAERRYHCRVHVPVADLLYLREGSIRMPGLSPPTSKFCPRGIKMLRYRNENLNTSYTIMYDQARCSTQTAFCMDLSIQFKLASRDSTLTWTHAPQFVPAMNLTEYV